MINRKKIILVIIMLAFTVLMAWACSGAEQKFTVQFQSVPSIEPMYTSRIQEMPNVERGGFRLEGWYYDQAHTSKVSFPLKVTRDLILWAKFEQTYTVSFRFQTPGNDPDIIYDTRAYLPGEQVFVISDPQRAGYEFDRWLQPIPEVMNNDNLVIWASFKANTYKVCFMPESGVSYAGSEGLYSTMHNGQLTAFPYVSVTYGDFFTHVLAGVRPEKENASFSGWTTYVYGEGRIDFSPEGRWAKTENILLRPVWVDKGSAGLRYELNADGNSYTVSKYVTSNIDGTDRQEHIIVPSQYNGLPVTAIGERCFQPTDTAESRLVSIELPSTITTIGDFAFVNCARLQQINIPSSVKTIGRQAFLNCVSVSKIVIPRSVEVIGAGAFMNCSQLQEVELYVTTQAGAPQLHTIGESAFEGASALRQISLPPSLKSLGDYAFFGCTQLARVEGLNATQIDRIGISAFEDCTSLTEIRLPQSVATVDTGAFRNCTQLRTLTFTLGLRVIGFEAFRNCTSLNAITLTSAISVIEARAFVGATSINEILIHGLTADSPNWNQDWDYKTEDTRFTTEKRYM
ncbi:MAG: leucine-rich repeat domain-containing protein [Firmicutes bacterium]|nr:leucine-rich repeat domain-containing protein [Bacillota bacterium]